MSPDEWHTQQTIADRLAAIRAEERREKLAQVAEDVERDARLARLLTGEPADELSRPTRP